LEGTGKETIVAQFEILSLYLNGTNEEYHDNQDRIFWSHKCEKATFRQQMRGVKYPIVTFVA